RPADQRRLGCRDRAAAGGTGEHSRGGEVTIMARSAKIHRETAETQVDLQLDLDGAGRAQIETGVGFFDHMLTLLSRHSLIDLSGRAFFVWKAEVPRETLGNFNAELAEEFWRAVASCGAFNLHVVLHHGRNVHHILEGIFKATARALRRAVETDSRNQGIPS